MSTASNPWDSRRPPAALRTLDLGGMEEYYLFARSLPGLHNSTAPPEALSQSPLRSVREGDSCLDNPIIALQKRLFELIEECFRYFAQLKAERDVFKFGEYLTSYEIEGKVGTLKRLTHLMRSFVEHRGVLVEHICAKDALNSIIVEEDLQDQFLTLVSLIQREVNQVSYYEMLHRAALMHGKLASKLEGSLRELRDAGRKCEEMYENYKGLREVLMGLQDKYCGK